jgi:hypothetical protein
MTASFYDVNKGLYDLEYIQSMPWSLLLVKDTSRPGRTPRRN